MKITWLLFALLFFGCAPLEPQRPPPLPPAQYIPYPVEKPVPCFTEAERPVLPPLTTINLDVATTDQKIAALAADFLNEETFSRAVDALFIRCTKGTS